MHSYLHNIKTFNNATRYLTRVERSLYRDAIELYYDTEKALPADDFDRLARRLLAHSEEEISALKFILSEFFERTGDVYIHHYCEEVIEAYHNLTTAKSLAGKASAAARKEKANQRRAARVLKKDENTTDDEHYLNTCSTGVANHKPITNNHNISNRAFAPPTLDEVRDYVTDNRYPVDPEKFCDFYASKGWMVGKNKMKDWKAAVRTWSKGNENTKPSIGLDPNERGISGAERTRRARELLRRQEAGQHLT